MEKVSGSSIVEVAVGTFIGFLAAGLILGLLNKWLKVQGEKITGVGDASAVTTK